MSRFDGLLDEAPEEQALETQSVRANRFEGLLDDPQELRANVAATTDIKPETAAEALRHLRRRGMPETAAVSAPETVVEAGRQAETTARVERINRESPALADWLKDPVNMAVARDDLDGLSALGEVMRFSSNIGRSLVSGGMNLATTSPTAIAGAGFETVTQAVGTESNLVGAVLGKIFMDSARGFKVAADAVRGDQEGAGFIEQGVAAGAESIGMNLLPLAAGVVTRSPQIALAGMTAATGGQEYLEARETLSPAQSAAYATIQAGWEYLTEAAPAFKLFGDLKAGTAWYKTVAHYMKADILGEQAATLLQDFTSWMYLNPEKTAKEFIDERPAAAAHTLIATIVASGAMGGGAVAINKVLESAERKENARAFGDYTKRVGDAAAALKLATTSPEKLEEILAANAEANGVATVYMPVEEFETYYQSAGLDPAEVWTDLTGSPDGYVEAALSRADLAIPFAKLLARTAAKPEEYKALQPHLKQTPDSMTAAEAEKFKPEIDATAAEGEALTAEATEAKPETKVEDDPVYQQAYAAFKAADGNDERAKASAALSARIFNRMAANDTQKRTAAEIYAAAFQTVPDSGIVGPDGKGAVPSQQPAPAMTPQTIPQQLLMAARETTNPSQFHPGSQAEQEMLAEAFPGMKKVDDGEGGKVLVTADGKLVQPLLVAEAERRLAAGTVDKSLSIYDNSHITAWEARAAAPQPPGLLLSQASKASLITQDYEGREGDAGSITRISHGLVPTRELDALDIGTAQPEDTDRPVLITVDPGRGVTVSEGAGRLAAARARGDRDVQVEIRYFGHSEREVPDGEYFQAARIRRPVPPEVSALASLVNALSVAKGQAWATNRDFKAALQETVVAAAKAAKVDLTDYSNPQTEAYLIDAAVREGAAALASKANAVGWYDSKTKKALRILSTLHPELATDESARFAMTWALAVTSNGLKVPKNFELAEAAYRGWRATGQMPTDIGVGTAAEAINDGLQQFNTLTARFGSDALRTFMVTKLPARDVAKAIGKKALSGEGQNVEVYGAAVLGPKIGNGFFANLYGHFEQLTIDRWLMRTWGRWTGSLIETKRDLIANKRRQFEAVIRMLTPETKKAFEEILGSKLTVSDLVGAADAIKAASTNKAKREAMVALSPLSTKQRKTLDAVLGEDEDRVSVGDELRKLGNRLSSLADGQVEAPRTTKERQFMRRVFNAALAELQRQHPSLTMADLQAVLWYPEKLLYDTAAISEADVEATYEAGGLPDYETAAAALARANGVEQSRIDAATKEIDDESAARRAAGLQPGDGAARPGGVAGEVADQVAPAAQADAGGVPVAGGVRGSAGLVDDPYRENKGARLEGSPAAVDVPGRGRVALHGFKPAQEAAQRYAAKVGITYSPPRTFVRVLLERARRIADAFTAMPDNPADPTTREAYEQMVKETYAQYEEILASGLTVEFITGENPYKASPRLAILDVVENNHLWVFPTEDGFGSDPLQINVRSPLLEDSPYMISGRVARANDIFRVVHDYFGHIQYGNGFRADGEENAWRSHVSMYSPLAARAMTSETRGQNSWLNFGPYGEANRTAKEDTTYADQKTGLMPEWASTEGARDETYAQRDLSPDRVRLNQLLYDKRLARGRGEDTDGPAYARLNAEIRTLREQVADASILKQDKRGSITFLTGGGVRLQLNKSMDWSTFLHEVGGHLYFDHLIATGTQQGADAQVVADLDALLAHVGLSVRAADGEAAIRAAVKAVHHELVATSAEAYFREGKAPTPELQSLFDRLSTYLLELYDDIKKLVAQGYTTPLSDEVRAVFDRMLASQEAIDAAKAQAGGPLLPIAEMRKLGVSEAKLRGYAEALSSAKNKLQAKLLADLWRKKTSEYKGWLRTATDEVEAEVAKDPVYAAIKLLARGAGPDAPTVALNSEQLVELYGEEFTQQRGESIMDALKAHGIRPTKDAEALEMAALRLGFEGADQMVQAITSKQPASEYVAAEAQRRVEEAHPDAMTDGTIEERAQAALHSSKRAQVLQHELELLGELAKTLVPSAAVIKEAARRLLGKRPVGEINPHRYLVAERKAASAATKAAAAAKYGEALVAKRQQAIAAALYREAQKAREQIVAFERLGKKLKRKATREGIAAGGQEFLIQVEQIAHVFGLGELSGARQQDWRSLREFVTELTEKEGETTAVSESVLAAVEGKGRNALKSIPLDQLTAAHEAIKNLMHIASRAKKVRLGNELITLEEAITSLEAASADLKRKPLPVGGSRDLSEMQKLGNAVNGLLTNMLRPETVYQELDGGKTGAWRNLLWIPKAKAALKLRQLKKAMAKRLKKLHDAMPKSFMDDMTKKVIIFPGVEASRATLVSIVLNTGNAGNSSRLLRAGITYDGTKHEVTEADIARFRAMLTEQEMDYVQGLWDAVNEVLWPEMVALQERMAGVPIERVEAVSFEAHGKTYRGGYWPLVYDDRVNEIGVAVAEGDALKILLASTQALTNKGATMARQKEVNAQPLMDYGRVLTRHLNMVMVDVAYREHVKHARRLLKNPRVSRIVLEVYGDAGMRALNGHLAAAVGAGGDYGNEAQEQRQIARYATGAFAVSALGLSIPLAAGNYFGGIIQSLPAIGFRGLARGLKWRYLNHEETAALITAKSSYLRDELDSLDHFYGQQMSKLNGKKGFKAAFWRVMMTTMRVVQGELSRTIWIGAYVNELEKHGDSDKAGDAADAAVSTTQVASQKHDLSTLERDPRFEDIRLFMSPMFVIFSAMHSLARGRGAYRTVGQRVAAYLAFGVFAQAAFMLAAGRGPGDEDDDDEETPMDWVIWAAKTIALFPLQTMPVISSIAAGLDAMISNKPMLPRSAPTAQAVSELVKAGKSLARNINDYDGDGEIDYTAMTADLVGAVGPTIGLPAAQVRRTVRGVDAIVNGEEVDRNAVLMLLYGPPKP